jgi:hypothetical protein
MQAFKLKLIMIFFCIAIIFAAWYIFRNHFPDSGFKRQVLILTRFHPHIISDSVYQRVQRTKIFLDSLRRFDSVKLRAILLARPGLPGHIQLLERIYQLQNK